ncbi:hypothetical protein [Paraburkholderia sp. RL17-337-BIB-A]|uniref:hypothetical protein n=1 Tax=Paraburkholderia sp. RL17-337-BIB-A TaxID=3031636 RepID=UPI0038B9BFBD
MLEIGGQEGQIDPSFVITHTVFLEEGPGMYKTFRDKEDGCIKAVPQAMNLLSTSTQV